MFYNYLKIALRNLRRNKVYSLINIAGLSIGLACCMLIILYTKDEVSYDRFQPKADRIHRIVVDETSPEGNVTKFGSTGMVPGPAFKRQVPEIEDFVRVSGAQFHIKKGADVFTQEAMKVDSSFFSIFAFDFLEGSPKDALKDPNSVVISEDVAERFFGTTSVVGRTLSIDYDGGFKDFTVSAVTKKSPQNSSVKIEMLMPMHRDKQQDDQWINFYLNTFVLLSPNADVKKVEAKFARIFVSEARQQLAEAREKWNYKHKIAYKLQPLLAMHLSTDYRADNGLKDDSNPVYSYILTGIAVFILLIACMNFVNLTVAHSLKRAKEIGIRKVVGGDRRQLIRQFLGESFVLSFLAFLLAIILVQVTLPFFNTLANKALSLSYLIDIPLVSSYLALFLLTGFLAGFYPALVLSGFNPVATLYGRFAFSGRAWLQKSLVVFQFTLSTFLIVGTLILYAQFNLLTTLDLGYNDRNVVRFNTGRIDYLKAQTFRNELLKNPEIQTAAPRHNGTWYTGSRVNGTQEIMYAVEMVDQDYLPIFGLKLLKGRNFSPAFPSDSSQSVLVNEAFVKEAGWKDPIGQTVDFFFRNHKYKVIGVVRDYHHESLYDKIKPQLFTTDPQMNSFGQFFVRIKPTDVPKTLKFIEKTFKSQFPTQPYEYSFKDEENRKQYEKEARWKQIISFAAVLTVFISCIGLFGLATLSAERRTKEIGIRKVLGASVMSIVRLLSSDFLKLVAAACVFAFPAAWWTASRFLQNYPYRIDIGWWMFAVAGLLSVVVALFTVGFQAVKAALANPVKSLRSE
ncbi:MAG: ABC transporter permease [Cytophagales bacterium]|nr:ABC transporter permease [Cytophagales bacterium]